MSIGIKLTAAAVVTLALGASLGVSPAYAHYECAVPPGGTRPVCHYRPDQVGAVIGAVRPTQCYYLPTVANGAVNGLRKVCS